ncbi:MAG: hypothetical protein ACXVCP_05180 [Bdellovibrio sp.]
MKTLMVILASLMSLSAFASKAESVNTASEAHLIAIPDNQLEGYKKAMALALEGRQFACKKVVRQGYDTTLSLESIKERIDGADSAILKENGSQPVLTFVNYGSNTRSYIRVTTNDNYKIILNIEVNSSELIEKEVNVGTLIKPMLVKTTTWSPYLSANCKFE